VSSLGPAAHFPSCNSDEHGYANTGLSISAMRPKACIRWPGKASTSVCGLRVPRRLPCGGLGRPDCSPFAVRSGPKGGSIRDFRRYRRLPALFASRLAPIAVARSIALLAFDLAAPLRRGLSSLLMFGVRH